ncbi:cell division protein PerM [Planctomonas deserti]|uniref:cell division protein PerM n=1 Tax=Planctomonas deserti TaxID=2144185 RepID=UPI000D36BD27|nr:DUF6350 family protein [Planctomonas deserti]
MNRPTTALFAALEALLVAAIGIGIPLVPLTVLWATQYDLQIDWAVFFRAAVDVWLLGHGADLAVVLDPAIAASLGLAGAEAPFTLTLAPLGFAVLTLLLGMRAGRRLGDTDHRALGLAAAVAVFALIAVGVTLLAQHPNAAPALAQGIVLPTLVFGSGVAIGSELGRRRRSRASAAGASLSARASSLGSTLGATLRSSRAGRAVLAPVRSARERLDAVPGHLRASAASALSGGAASAFAVIAAASIAVAVLLATGYARVITLYESLQTGVAGGIALTLAQLALIPNVVLWGASWLVGPGFAIGTGSSVSPLGTSLGPIPALPLLGPLPQGELTFGLLGVLVPVLAGFLSAVALQPRVRRAFGGTDPGRRWLAAVGAGMGLAGAVVLAVLTWWSAGSAGPGRLADVGPSPWWVLLFAFLEIGGGAVLGMLAAARGIRLPRRR